MKDSAWMRASVYISAVMLILLCGMTGCADGENAGSGDECAATASPGSEERLTPEAELPSGPTEPAASLKMQPARLFPGDAAYETVRSAVLAQQLQVPGQPLGEAEDIFEDAALFELSLQPPSAPAGRFYALLLDTGRSRGSYDLWLLAGDELDTAEIVYLASAGDVAWNTAKLLFTTAAGAEIQLWSEKPFSSEELRTTLFWDGSSLEVVERVTGFESMAHYALKEELLKSGRVGEAMLMGEPETYPYLQDPLYFRLPLLALREAHRYALLQHEKDDPHAAAEALQWGLDEYFRVHFSFSFYSLPAGSADELARVLEEAALEAVPHEDYRMPFGDLLGIINDYAFFRAEAGDCFEAEIFLREVTRLAPHRTVAYLNLADVQWCLHKRREAAASYTVYAAQMEQRGLQESIPERVKLRKDPAAGD